MKRYGTISKIITVGCAAMLIVGPAAAQRAASDLLAPAPPANEVSSVHLQPNPASVEALMRLLAAHEERIKELEARLAAATAPANTVVRSTGLSLASIAAPAVPAPVAAAAETAAPATIVPSAAPPMDMATSAPAMSAAADPHDHMLNMPGSGPSLKIRGFFDFSYGMGQVANPLIFPLGAPAHNTFQAGEFDLFMSSKLTNHISFVGEMVFGSDATNALGIDIERYELTWKQNKYFEVSAGRYHTTIGYYNTAYHHGTWFGTADGRPFMYYYEDSGGLLPVHNVGLQATGLMPGTGRLNMHWVAEVGNGRASSLNAAQVQNFLSDRNHKAVNFAVYVKPEWLEGLQVGGSFYVDRLYPDGFTGVTQHIASAYAVYFKNGWESLNEGVWLQNQSGFNGRTYNTPLMYSQISHQFGPWVPFFRFQYVNAPAGDPVNVFAGRYEGPSEGIRYNFSDYAALKLQYNRIYGINGSGKPGNGLVANVSLTF